MKTKLCVALVLVLSACTSRPETSNYVFYCTLSDKKITQNYDVMETSILNQLVFSYDAKYNSFQEGHDMSHMPPNTLVKKRNEMVKMAEKACLKSMTYK